MKRGDRVDRGGDLVFQVLAQVLAAAVAGGVGRGEDDGNGSAEAAADCELEAGGVGEHAVDRRLHGAEPDAALKHGADLSIDQRRNHSQRLLAAGGEVDAEGEADMPAGGQLYRSAAFQPGDLAKVDVETDV